MADPVTGLSPEARADLRATVDRAVTWSGGAAMPKWRWEQIAEALSMLDAAERVIANRDQQIAWLTEQSNKMVADVAGQRDSLQRQLDDARRRLDRATSLEVLYDALYEAQWGDSAVSADERESCAQLAEAVKPLLLTASSPVTESRNDPCNGAPDLMAALRESIDRARESRNEPSRNEGDRDAPLA